MANDGRRATGDGLVSFALSSSASSAFSGVNGPSVYEAPAAGGRTMPSGLHEAEDGLDDLIDWGAGVDLQRCAAPQERLDGLQVPQHPSELSGCFPYGLFVRVANRSTSRWAGALSRTMWSNCA